MEKRLTDNSFRWKAGWMGAVRSDGHQTEMVVALQFFRR